MKFKNVKVNDLLYDSGERRYDRNTTEQEWCVTKIGNKYFHATSFGWEGKFNFNGECCAGNNLYFSLYLSKEHYLDDKGFRGLKNKLINSLSGFSGKVDERVTKEDLLKVLELLRIEV